MVTNSYLARGGDSFAVFTGGRNAVNTGILDREALAAHLRAQSPLSAKGFVPDRIVRTR